MRIEDIFKSKKAALSFEVFPPKKTDGLEALWPALERLSAMHPDYISVTYSAGGKGDSDRTVEIATRLKRDYQVEPVAHLTCVNSTRDHVIRVLDSLEQGGVENVLALRGDIDPDVPPKDEFHFASDLVRLIHKRGGFDIAGACYPEGHPQSATLEEDIDHLKEKVDCGVSHLVTQLFFDNADFYRFRNLCAKKGITVPMQAGIMPVTNKRQIQRIVSMCGASLPRKFSRMMSLYENSPEALRDASIAYATEQIVDLISDGADGIHLYTMNNVPVAQRIVTNVHSMFHSING